RFLPLLQRHRHDTAEPRTARTAQKPTGAEPLGLLHRKRGGGEHVPIGTADDGALHQVPESLPQEARPACCPGRQKPRYGIKGTTLQAALRTPATPPRPLHRTPQRVPPAAASIP